MTKRLTKKLRNPFVYEGYESPDYFCDRFLSIWLTRIV